MKNSAINKLGSHLLRSEIPFTKPFIAGNEAKYVAQVIASGSIGSDGRFTRSCAQFLKNRFGIHEVFMTPSCTAALEMAAMLLDLKHGDEVLMPSFTFTSTANAVVLRGAKPVFVDIRPDTLNLDEHLVENSITSRTRAIFAVHYAGVGCEMERLMAIAAKHNLLVVEDAAQAVNGYYRGRALGSIGHLGAYSFHSTKDYTCGEGGALCVNSPELAAQAEIIRDKGTNRSKFFRGEVDKYSWVDAGSSYVPGEIACAFLLAQLEMMDAIKARRAQLAEHYRVLLSPLEQMRLLSLPQAPAECDASHHMYYVLLPDQETRDRLIVHLRDRRIRALFHYVPLHCSPMGARLGYREGAFPRTEQLSGRLLRLPFYPDLSAEEQQRVVRGIESFFRVVRTRKVFTGSPLVESA
ncbi:MAG TPA: dTDP-4-amino-4,6-dideoxygalactose transaminase [Bryobacteraceae bacterium]|jgi:dTDP-4-amino-4,6-dideoxygalactose transaminase